MRKEVQKPLALFFPLQSKETQHPSVEMNKEQVTNSIYLTSSKNISGLISTTVDE